MSNGKTVNTHWGKEGRTLYFLLQFAGLRSLDRGSVRSPRWGACAQALLSSARQPLGITVSSKGATKTSSTYRKLPVDRLQQVLAHGTIRKYKNPALILRLYYI